MKRRNRKSEKKGKEEEKEQGKKELKGGKGWRSKSNNLIVDHVNWRNHLGMWRGIRNSSVQIHQMVGGSSVVEMYLYYNTRPAPAVGLISDEYLI